MSTAQTPAPTNRIAIATDDAGVALRDHLVTVLDSDPPVQAVDDYPIPCIRAAEAVRDDRAVVLGSTGLPLADRPLTATPTPASLRQRRPTFLPTGCFEQPASVTNRLLSELNKL